VAFASRLFLLFAALAGFIPSARAQFFVADQSSGLIYEFSSTGSYLGGVSVSPGVYAESYEGTTLYADAYAGSSRANYVYDYTYGAPIGLGSQSTFHQFTSSGQSPTAVASTSSEVYVGTAAGLNGAVTLFSDSGIQGTSFSVTGSVVGLAAANNLFVATGGGNILEYSLTGAAVNSSFLTSLTGPLAIAATSTDLYVVSSAVQSGITTDSVTDYALSANGAITGSHILISGLTTTGTPAITVSGLYLLVSEGANGGGADVAEYTTAGVLVNGDVASAGAIDALAAGSLAAIPEPPLYGVLLGLAALGGALAWKLRRLAV